MKTRDIRAITDERGRRLRLAEDLASHVARRSPRPRFVVTYWLRTLSDAVLSELGEHAFAIITQASTQHDVRIDEFHAVMMLAVKGERSDPNAQLHPQFYREHTTTMLGCISVEMCRRRGWMLVGTPSGVLVQPDFDVSITDKGVLEFQSGIDVLLDVAMVTAMRAGLDQARRGSK